MFKCFCMEIVSTEHLYDVFQMQIMNAKTFKCAFCSRYTRTYYAVGGVDSSVLCSRVGWFCSRYTYYAVGWGDFAVDILCSRTGRFTWNVQYYMHGDWVLFMPNENLRLTWFTVYMFSNNKFLIRDAFFKQAMISKAYTIFSMISKT